MLNRALVATAALSLSVAGLAGCGTSGTSNVGFQTTASHARVFTVGGQASVLVKRVGGASSLSSLSFGGHQAVVSESLRSLGYSKITVPVGQLDAAVSALRADSSVLSAEPNLERHVIRPTAHNTVAGSLFNTFARAAAPNDPMFSKQYAPTLTHAVDAWATSTGKGQTIAIVDTGVDSGHPDLKAHAVAGWNTVSNNNNSKDDYGHGTHCAGISAAIANNKVGVAGIAPDAKIMSVKVLGADGSGSDETVASGITWAADHGATVISLSLGGSGESQVLGDAVAYALKKGVPVVAAMGNDGTNEKSYPAAYPGVIAVGASDNHDQIADFSQWGDWISISSPGVRIFATLPTYHVAMNDEGFAKNYDYLDGTSMATPAAAGMVADIRAKFPSLDPSQVKARVEATADKVSGQADFDPHYGHGRINVLKAVSN